MTDLLLAGLRAVHILGAVFWAGSTFLFAGYHEFLMDPGDPERTLTRIAESHDMSNMVGYAGITSAAAGLILYWFVSNGLAMGWITSPYGLAITLGALSAIAAIAVGIPTVAQANDRATELHATYEDAGELTAEQAAEAHELYETLTTGERMMAILIGLAVLLMATAQYL